MSISQDIIALQARFVSAFTAARPAIKVIYDNQAAQEIPASETFVRFVVRPGASERASFTTTTTRHTQLGRVFVQIMTPKGEGTGTAMAIADDIANAFRLWKSADGYLRTYEPEITTISAESDRHHVTSISIRYEATRFY